MTTRYECRRCWKTSQNPHTCCGAPMILGRLDEGIFWPLMWLPEPTALA